MKRVKKKTAANLVKENDDDKNDDLMFVEDEKRDIKTRNIEFQ